MAVINQLIIDHECGNEFHDFTSNLCGVKSRGNGRISRYGVPRFLKNGRILFAVAFVFRRSLIRIFEYSADFSKYSNTIREYSYQNK
jgi:hypothetical protein